MNRPILFNLFEEGPSVLVVVELLSEDRYCDRILDMNAEVDPFPFVPAIWMTFNLFRSAG